MFAAICSSTDASVGVPVLDGASVIGAWFHLAARVGWCHHRIGLEHAASKESQRSEGTPHILWDDIPAYLALSFPLPFFPSPSP
jgi:hypothetical protein